jgi:inositol-pentakisphosphate 2-kinase
VDWQEKVLKPDLQDVGDQTLLPPLLRVQGTQDHLRPFLRQIAAKIEPIRPLERRRVSGVDEEQTTAIFVTEDLSATVPGVPSLVFEIKPKCGFLPSTATLSATTKGDKGRHSRFRMHSILKNKNTTMEEFAQLYDPLDLYDQDPGRIAKASNALFASWERGVGNNLRIFIDGCKVEADEKHASHQKAKEAASHIHDTGGAEGNLRIALLYVLSSPIARSALERLKNLQQKYDPLDVEGVDAICKEEYGKSVTELVSDEISLTEYEEVVGKSGIHARPASLTAREVIAAFLLSTMYKDCSLFIRTTVQSGFVETCIHLVDLDPKPISKLAYLYTIDQEIVTTFHDWAQAHALRQV